MIHAHTYKCPKCGKKVTIKMDLPAEETKPPKYAPTCQNEEKHHSNRVFEMELQ